MLRVLRFLGRTNLFISLGSFFSVLGAFAFVGAHVDYTLASFAFFAALFTYNFQRKIGDLNYDQTYSKVGNAFMIAGLVGLSIFAFQLSLLQLVVLSIAGLLSLAYAYPFIPTARQKISLRLVPGAKLWTIVLVWTLSCVFLPAMSSSLGAVFMLLFIVQQAAFVAALTLPFDIRDLAIDWPSQKTIPQQYGVAKSRKIAIALLLLSATACLLLFVEGAIDSLLFFIHLGVLLTSAVLIAKAKIKSRELYFTIAIDGMLILQGAAFFLSEYAG